MSDLIFVILMVSPLLVSILGHLLYWYVKLDQEMVQRFRIIIDHEFYQPFRFTDSLSYKIDILNELKDEAAEDKDYKREYNVAAHEILSKMRYDLKIIRCQAKANKIIEKMHR